MPLRLVRARKASFALMWRQRRKLRDSVCLWLCLRVEALDRDSANCDAREHRQSHHVSSFHAFLPTAMIGKHVGATFFSIAAQA